MWFSKLKDEIQSGAHKDITDTEGIILEDYLSNYVYFRLGNMFTVDVSKPVLVLIAHFESNEPKIFDRWEVLRDFFHDLLQKSMKNAGNWKNSSTKDLLKIDFQDRSLQLSNSNLYLGSKVESFLTQLGLTRDSIEIQSWLEGVRKFYIEALEKTVKYFKPSLLSKSLRYMDIINPMSFIEYELDVLKSRYKYIAEKFPNIIPKKDLPDLLDQVASMTVQKSIIEAVTVMSAEEFFGKLATFKGGRYKLVALLGQALLTIHNSSTQAERDFSVQVDFVDIFLIL